MKLLFVDDEKAFLDTPIKRLEKRELKELMKKISRVRQDKNKQNGETNQ